MTKLDRLFKEPTMCCVKQNNIVTTPIKAAINHTNMELLFGWLECLRDQKLNESTIKTYQQTIVLVFCWNVLDNDNTCILEWDRYDLMSFYNWCIVDNKLKYNRIRYIRQVLFKFINYITRTQSNISIELLAVNEDLRFIERKLHTQERQG